MLSKLVDNSALSSLDNPASIKSEVTPIKILLYISLNPLIRVKLFGLIGVLLSILLFIVSNNTSISFSAKETKEAIPKSYCFSSIFLVSSITSLFSLFKVACPAPVVLLFFKSSILASKVLIASFKNFSFVIIALSGMLFFLDVSSVWYLISSFVNFLEENLPKDSSAKIEFAKGIITDSNCFLAADFLLSFTRK